MSGVRLVEAGSAKVAIDYDAWKAATKLQRTDRRYNTDMLGGAPLWCSKFDRDMLLQIGRMLVSKGKAPCTPGIPAGDCGQVKWEKLETTPGGSPSAAATWDAAILARQCFRTAFYAAQQRFAWFSQVKSSILSSIFSWTASGSLVVNSTPPPEYDDCQR